MHIRRPLAASVTTDMPLERQKKAAQIKIWCWKIKYVYKIIIQKPVIDPSTISHSEKGKVRGEGMKKGFQNVYDLHSIWAYMCILLLRTPVITEEH